MDKNTLDLFSKVNEALQGQFSQLKLMHELASVLTTKYLDLQSAHKALQSRVDILEQLIEKLRSNHDELANQFDEHAHITPTGQAVSSNAVPRNQTFQKILDRTY